MATYVVQAGDSPASIAARGAGCPKCAVDLVRANPHKEAKSLPNGFLTFKDLRVGETLNLPSKWFDGRLDDRPRAYFAALSSADGITVSALGSSSGVLSDYATLDNANDSVAHIATLSDADFEANMDTTAALLDTSVNEVLTAPGAASVYAQAVLTSTSQARQLQPALQAAVATGAANAGFVARDQIMRNFSDAMVSARKALQLFYADPTPTPTVTPAPASHAPVPPLPSPPVVVLTPAQTASASQSAGTSSMLGVTVLGAGVIGGAIYLTMYPPKELRRAAKRALRKRR